MQCNASLTELSVRTLDSSAQRKRELFTAAGRGSLRALPTSGRTFATRWRWPSQPGVQPGMCAALGLGLEEREVVDARLPQEVMRRLGRVDDAKIAFLWLELIGGRVGGVRQLHRVLKDTPRHAALIG